MTIYETIKAAISVKQAAEHYGLKVSHNGMACCPFHNDRHPSLKLNEDYFFCFGCGAKGDVIDLVARLFDLSSYEAAQKLAADFGLDPKPPTAAAMVKPKRPYIRQFREDEMLCFRVLTDYLHLLEDWKVRYAPKTPEDALDDRFVEACQMHCHIEYMADVLTVGDLEERVALVDKLMQDGKIAFLQEYTARKKEDVSYNMSAPAKRLFSMMYMGNFTEGSLDATISAITKDEKIQRTLKKKLKGKGRSGTVPSGQHLPQ